MKAVISAAVLFAASGFGQQAGMDALKRELEEVARVATVMVDGDVCQRIETPRSAQFQLKKDPRDPWIASDNYDVRHDAFILTKKVLMRLARLTKFPCDVNLWMPLPVKPPRIQAVVRNVNEMSQFWTFGVLNQDMPPEMRKVLETGERVTVTRRAGMVSVLAPVYNSLDEIASLVEVVGRIEVDPSENVK